MSESQESDPQIAALFVRLVEITVQEYWRLGHRGIELGLQIIADAHAGAHDWQLNRDDIGQQAADYVSWRFDASREWWKEGPEWMKQSG